MVLTRLRMCVVMGMIAVPAAAGESLAIRVMPGAGFAPSDVIVESLIEPHTRNRSVAVEIDSANFYTSSTTELEGERAPRAVVMRFRKLPAGSYEARVTLVGTDGQRGYVMRTFTLW